MIEKMKIVGIVAPFDKKDKMLSEIRNLGVLHISEKKKADSELLARFDELSKIEMLLKEQEGSSYNSEPLSDNDFEKLHGDVVNSISLRRELSEKKNKLCFSLDKIKEWGCFKPSDIRELEEEGVKFHFYKMGKKELYQLQASGADYIMMSAFGKTNTVAVVGEALDKSFPANEFVIPQLGVPELSAGIEECDAQISLCEKILSDASKELSSYKEQILKCKNAISYSSVSNTSGNDDNLVWLTGYIPLDNVEEFKKAANVNTWAYVLDDPDDEDELVPTKVKYTKVTSLMKPVFDILGTVPGYREYDISFWFLCFFALFFAMIIGDAGYGFLFLALGVLLNVKQKKTTNLTMLIYVVSATTIVWGAMTGTWFGLASAMNVGILRSLVVKPLANYPEAFGYSPIAQQNSMMKLCFIIGTVQLTLACVMSIRRKWLEKNDSWIADAGWLMSINSLYYVVLFLVIGEDVNLIPFAFIVGCGFILVCLFGGMNPKISFKDGLKAGLGDAFTNFLNTISAFGNVMSYIRLFAVGLASLAIAQSFNDMASGLTGAMKVLGVLIFVVGHALNLVMGLLSVVVHGVRLNLLEFSGQLGMEWSGLLYEPFKVEEK